MDLSIVMVRALAEAIERSGPKRERFLREVEIPESTLREADGRVSLTAYRQAVEVARTIAGVPAFGFHMSKQLPATLFDVVGPVLGYAGSLRAVCDTLARYARLMAVGHDPELHERGERAWIRFPTLGGDDAFAQVMAEFVMTGMLTTLRLYVGPDAQPLRADFAYKEPDHKAEYDRVFGGRQRFARPFTQLEFPRPWLDLQHPFPNAEIYGLLKAEADRKLTWLDRPGSLGPRIEALLQRRGRRGELTVADVAGELRMSARSLQRRMRQEGVRFGELVARCRAEEAKRLLRAPDSSIQQAAHALGFTSVSAFHRAFKRWTGSTPREYRDSL